MNILETRRLVVRELEPGDAPAMLEYLQEEVFRRELPDEVPEDLDDAQGRIRFFRGNYAARSLPLVYALVRKADGQLVGHMELAALPEQQVEIGYGIAAPARGQGLAAEAARPFSLWALQALGIPTLYGHAKAANPASCRTLEQCGYRFQREESWDFWGERHLFRIYSFPPSPGRGEGGSDGIDVAHFQEEHAQAVSRLITDNLLEVNTRDYSWEEMEEHARGFTADRILEYATRRHMFVALRNGQVVGTAGVTREESGPGEHVVFTVFVHPECHGMGVGRLLMDRIREQAASIGAKKLLVPASITAAEFYQRLGYRYAGGVKQLNEHNLYPMELCL